MNRVRRVPRAALFLLGMASGALAQEALPRFTQFDFARERIGHKVVVDVTLVNPGALDLADARITVSYFDGDRELRKSKPVLVAKIPAGQSASFKIEVVNVPNFERYILYLEIGSRKLIYVGNQAAPMPSPRSLPEKLVLETCTDAKPKGFPGDVSIKIAVTNAGDLDAREPFAIIVFQDAAGLVVQRTRVTLAESIKARHRDLFELTVPRVPSYASASAAVGWIAAEYPAQATTEGQIGDLALTACRIVRFTDGAVRVSGKAKNGLATEVSKASATFKLGSGEHTVALPSPLKPGDEKGFEFIVLGCPAFEDWEFSIAYGDAAIPCSVSPNPLLLAAKRTESKEIGLDGAGLPKPRERDPLEEGPATNKNVGESTATAEIRGLFWVEGTTLKNKQYTGDIAFLKVAFRDSKGKVFQPVGVLSATVYVDGERRAVTRQFRKESWKVEAGKVNATTVTPDFMASDAAAGDLWVGLFRWDKMAQVSRVDISIRIVDVGSWEWKGLEKICQASPKAPEKK